MPKAKTVKNLLTTDEVRNVAIRYLDAYDNAGYRPSLYVESVEQDLAEKVAQAIEADPKATRR